MAPILCDSSSRNPVSFTTEEESGCDLLDELAQLEALLEHLTVKRFNLKRKINWSHSPMIRQLSPDVMSLIFQFCLPDFSHFQPLPSRWDLCAPLSLGAICNYWREIAWSTPSLWSSLILDIAPHKSESQAAIAHEWLARSGQLLLSIRIFSTSLSDSMTPIAELARIINQYSTRWSDFDLCIPQRGFQYFRATNNHAPILKSIRFYTSEPSLRHDTENFQLTCPLLQRAYLSSVIVDKYDIQWDNLTHLDLTNVLFIECLRILRKASRLVFLSFSHGYGYIPYGLAVTQPVRPIVLTSLRSLRIVIMNEHAKIFLDHLMCPHLEELSVGTGEISALEAIVSLIKRTACSLRSFSITDGFKFIPVPYGHSITEKLISLLRLMPSLKNLSVAASDLRYDPPKYHDRWHMLEIVAKVLSLQRIVDERRFLPNLETLEYTGKLRLRPLFRLPPADNAVRGPLRLIKFELYPAIRILPIEATFFFESLMERGITVNVFSGSEDILQPSLDHRRSIEARMRRDWVDDMDLNLIQDMIQDMS